MHARRTASASASVVVRRSGSSLHLCFDLRSFSTASTNFVYNFGGTVEDYYAFGADARARARTPRRNVDVLRFATTPCERVPRYLFYTLLHSLSLSFFAFLLFLAFLESHFILRDIVRTITQTKLNAEIVRRVFFFILVIFIFISIIFIYFYMYYLIIFFRLNLFRIDTEKTSRDSKEGLK